VVCPEPLCGVVLHLLYGCEHALIQSLVPDGSVVTFDVGVLPRFAGLDMLDGNAACFGPFQQLRADVFKAIRHEVHRADCIGLVWHRQFFRTSPPTALASNSWRLFLALDESLSTELSVTTR
jgi:hypothetical protein